MKRILLTGANGQVGVEIQRCAAGVDGLQVVAAGRHDLDVADEAAVRAALETGGYHGVINAAAYTAVDKAESEPELAEAVNARAPEILAKACAKAGAALVHYSTDYVFDGTSRRPYREDDPTAPLGVYGRTKRAGEVAALASGAPCAVIRLAWVFSAHGGNFVKTMLRVGAERGAVRVVDDQYGKPTPARGAAAAGMALLAALIDDRSKGGVYHYCGDEATSWAGFAEAIFAEARMEVPVAPIPTSDYPTPAARPAYSVLDTGKIENELGLEPADWRAALKEVIGELRSKGAV